MASAQQPLLSQPLLVCRVERGRRGGCDCHIRHANLSVPRKKHIRCQRGKVGRTQSPCANKTRQVDEQTLETKPIRRALPCSKHACMLLHVSTDTYMYASYSHPSKDLKKCQAGFVTIARGSGGFCGQSLTLNNLNVTLIVVGCNLLIAQQPNKLILFRNNYSALEECGPSLCVARHCFPAMRL